eukprot:2601125-Prymnesium_polylepis.1
MNDCMHMGRINMRIKFRSVSTHCCVSRGPVIAMWSRGFQCGRTWEPSVPYSRVPLPICRQA